MVVGKSLRVVWVVALSLFCAACASTRARFPDYGEYIKGRVDIDVVIDSIMISDIAGVDLGFNSDRNSKAIEDVKTTIQNVLEERGFSPNIAQVMNGLFYERDLDKQYFYSEGWKSKGIAYGGYENKLDETGWTSNEVRLFFDAVIKEAGEMKRGKKSDAETKKDGSSDIESSEMLDTSLVSFNEWGKFPDEIAALPSGILLYVRGNGRLQSMGKDLAKGLLGGLVSSALTGGTIILIPPGSIITVEIAALDVKAMNIVWHQRWGIEGTKRVSRAVSYAMKNYPHVTGEYPLELKRARERCRQKIACRRQATDKDGLD